MTDIPSHADYSTEAAGQFWNDHVPGVANKKTWIRSYDYNNHARLWFVEQIRAGESLLDVGCGPGVNYEHIKNSGKDITYRGIDVGSEFVQACQELFPEADFQVGDAMALDEPDNSWDTVLLSHVLEHTVNFQDPIQEALRVAKRRVIIIMWRPLHDHQPDRYVVHAGGGSNDYNSTTFKLFLDQWLYPRTHRAFLDQQRNNWGWIIHKTLDTCVFDLDDYVDFAPNLGLLPTLKQQFPALKVTLFGIPTQMTKRHSRQWANYDWVEIAPHGYTHEPNTEVLAWSERDAHQYLYLCETSGFFVKGFKAPGWQINQATLDVLRERDYWVACQPKQVPYCRQIGLPYYVAEDHPFSVHGHFMDMGQKNPRLRNGLAQLINERGLFWDEKTEFKFVSEVLERPT